MAVGIEYHVRTILELQDKQTRAMKRAVAQTQAMTTATHRASMAVTTFGATVRGQAGMAAAAVGKVTAAFALLAGGVGIGAAIKSGMDFNIQMEQMTYSVASMFQMYNKHQGDFNKNLHDSQAMMQRLYAMAAKAPGEFEDVARIYQMSATALTIANVDMEKQVGFMKRAMMLLSTAPELKEMGGGRILGSQLGRTLMGGAGEEMELYKKLRPAMLGAAQKMLPEQFGKTQVATFSAEWNKFARSSPRMAFEVMNEALKPLEEVASEFAVTWDAILGDTQSTMRVIKGAFADPMFKALKESMVHLNTVGLFSGDNVNELASVAYVLGSTLGKAVDRLYIWAQQAVIWFRKHWIAVANAIYHAFQAGALLLKVSFARLIAGSIIMAFGTGIRMLEKARFGVGLLGGAMRGGPGKKRKGMLETMGEKYRGARRRHLLRTSKGQGLPRVLRSQVQGFTRQIVLLGTHFTAAAVSLVPFLLGLGMMAVVAGIAFVAVAGIAAYIVENWVPIMGGMLKQLEGGEGPMRKLIEAGMVLWATFVMFGEKLLGVNKSQNLVNGAITTFTEILNVVQNVVGGLIYAFGALVGIWGMLKIAFGGFMTIAYGLIKLASLVPGTNIDMAKATRNYNDYVDSTAQTVLNADEYMQIGRQMMDATLKDVGLSEADVTKRMEELAAKMKNFLDEAGVGGKGAKVPPRDGTNIQKVVIEMDLRDQDPDRIMALFVDELSELTDKPTQAKGLVGQGA